MHLLKIFISVLVLVNLANSSQLKRETKKTNKHIAYIVSDIRIPFWEIMSRGIKKSADSLGYELNIYSSDNSAKLELEATVKAIRDKVAAIIISPTSSSACVTVLNLANKAGIPVVISDVGTDHGEYISFISSDNKDGAYKIGQILANEMRSLNLIDGEVGIIAIPQKRLNGQLRTAGFMQAMDEAGIKGAAIKQQVTFSEKETYDLSKELIENYPKLRAIWLQGSNRYQGALKAIADAKKKYKILLITFDAEPEFLDLIPNGVLVGSAMQQPYLMGKKALVAVDKHLNSKKIIKNQQLPILAISSKNIADKLSIIKQNVLGIEQR